jgi:hypothetical protein
LRDEYTRTIEPACARAAETLKLERTLSDLVNQAYTLTAAEIGLMQQTAAPRMPIPLPATGVFSRSFLNRPRWRSDAGQAA